MKYTAKALAAVIACLGSIALPAQAQQADPNAGVPVELREQVRDSYIFVLEHDMPAGQVAGRAAALTRQQGGTLGRVYSSTIKGFSAQMPAAAAARLAARNPEVLYYEKDQIATAFQSRGRAAGKRGPAASVPQQTPWGITRVRGPVDGSGLTAWVIDTGIDLDHPDLNVDTGRSANFVRRGKKTANDGNGHGTHVAGTIAAVDNDIDAVGVAAGAWVVSIRVLDNSGRGSYSGIIAGVDYVAANADTGDVANMSLGGPASRALDDAVTAAADKGIYFAIAAGNSSADAADFSPARAEHPNIYTVSAIDSADRFAWFSNYGSPPIDCAGPGVSVISTSRDGGTETLSGTSMAAPHVAGILLTGFVDYDGMISGDRDGDPDRICVLP